jgi:hypothetical protein
MDQRTIILTLLDQICAHLDKKHWTISMRIFGKGDFFQKMIAGGDCRTSTAERVMRWFDANWPEDLTWPTDIPRPPKSKKEAA